ncbi:MAG TPA: mechanosensitive ion channel family protein, partial [Geobacteraceae bacterium]|nr:mechanosensitive ion channel family protein [Geobacteraceae bacterium]
MIRWISILSTLLMLLAVAVPRADAAGEEGRTETATMPEAALETAPVEIDGQVLFRVRGASSYPAAQRAAAIEKRIEAAADSSFRSDRLSIEDTETTAMIMAGYEALMVVTDADAKLEHANRDHLASLHLTRIRQAIDDYRRIRSNDALLRGGLYAG